MEAKHDNERWRILFFHRAIIRLCENNRIVHQVPLIWSTLKFLREKKIGNILFLYARAQSWHVHSLTTSLITLPTNFIPALVHNPRNHLSHLFQTHSSRSWKRDETNEPRKNPVLFSPILLDVSTSNKPIRMNPWRRVASWTWLVAKRIRSMSRMDAHLHTIWIERRRQRWVANKGISGSEVWR